MGNFLAMVNKKIIIVSPAYPYRGGQALVEAYLHKALRTMNYDTFTISYKLLYPKIFFPGKTQYDKSKIIPFEHSDKIYRILNSINPITWISAFRKIKQEKPDVVIIVWWMFFFAPCLSVLSWLIKHFAKEIHISFLVENYISHENHWFENILVRSTLKHADSFIVESHYIHNEIKKDFLNIPIFETTLNVYDCYDLKRYDKDSAKSFLDIKTKNVLLFFGLIRPYKGLDKLINAFPNILLQEPDTTLVIAGECYEDLTKYTNLIDKHSLNKNIKLETKFIANEFVEPYFRATDVVVMPYNSGTQSGILMMSYGFRVPVVATDVGGIRELIKKDYTGIIINDNGIQNICNAVIKILRTKNKVNYAENIECFIADMGYNKLDNIIKQIIDLQRY